MAAMRAFWPVAAKVELLAAMGAGHEDFMVSVGHLASFFRVDTGAWRRASW